MSVNRTIQKIGSRVFRRLPEIYVAIALLVTTLLCVLTLPFLVPDEANHAKREIELSRLELFARKTPLGVGTQIDSNVLLVIDRFNKIQGTISERYPNTKKRPDGRISAAQLTAMDKVQWAHQSDFTRFQNTAIYPPLAYVPQAIGWRLGDVAGMTILHSLVLARFFAACCAILLGWLALRMCGTGRWILFACLLLPAELSLNASCSQDALLLPIAVLLTVILSRAIALRRGLTTPELLFSALLLTAFIGARVAYLPLAFVLLLPVMNLPEIGWRQFARPLAAMALIIGLVGIWQLQVRSFGPFLAAQANPELQLAFLRNHPFKGSFYLIKGTIKPAPGMAIADLEILGENDAFPPKIIDALLALGIGGIAWLTPWVGLKSGRARLLLLIALLGSVLGVSLAMYLYWSPVQFHRIEGLQPRYYLPLIPFVLLLFSRERLGATLENYLPARLRERLLFFTATMYVAAVLYTPWVAAHRFYNLGLTAAVKLVLR
jgi:uncharacterized membrane protein